MRVDGSVRLVEGLVVVTHIVAIRSPSKKHGDSIAGGCLIERQQSCRVKWISPLGHNDYNVEFDVMVVMIAIAGVIMSRSTIQSKVHQKLEVVMIYV